MKKTLLLLLIIGISRLTIAQCSLIELSLNERAANSNLIIEGEVKSKTSFWNKERKMIYTSNIIEVYKVFKGNLIISQVEILTMGGTVEASKIVVEPSLELNVGDVGIFTCENIKRYDGLPISKVNLPQYEVYGSLQGFIKYDPSNRTAFDPFKKYSDIKTELYDKVLDSSLKKWIEFSTFDINKLSLSSAQKNSGSIETQATIGFSPIVVTSGTKTTITITGNGFGATRGTGTVGFKNADNGGASYLNPIATQYVSWSDNQIIVEVPTKAGTGNITVTPENASTFTSSETLTINYAHSNVTYEVGAEFIAFGTQHINNNGSGGYTWRMNTGFDSDAAAKASFMRAFDTWRCNTGINWTIGATTSLNVAADDAENVICFDNANPLSAGILGICYSYFSGCFTGSSTMNWYIKGLDIVFDEGSNITPRTWQYGVALPTTNQYDFETVAVHELGHGHQLGHVISPGAIMHYAISNGTSNRPLGVNDLGGGNYVQNKSTTQSVCSKGLMTNHNCGAAPVAAFSVSSRTVCLGAQASFSDLSTNTPTAWSWTLTGATPSTSSSQNPNVTYNTPGVYQVILSASNASGSDIETQSGYITVNTLPVISIAGSSSVCSGSSLILTASGATSYSWNTGASTSSVSVSPGSNTTYTVTGTNSSGCVNSATKLVEVNACGGSVFSGGVCGSTLSGIDQTITWTAITGATNYRVKIISTTSTFSTVNVRNQGAIRNFKLSWVPGIQYGQDYEMSISAYVNGAWQGYGPVCNVSTAPLASSPTSSLTASSCAKSLSDLDELLYFTGVPMATNYRLEISNAAQSFTSVNVRNNTVLNYKMSWITGVQYGTTYNVRIGAMLNGVWQDYGSVCTVTTPSMIPTTQLSICGQTVSALNTVVNFSAVQGATKYRVEYSTSTFTLVNNRPNNVTKWALSYVSGTQLDTVYKIRVAPFVGGVWGDYGASCSLTAGEPKLTRPGIFEDVAMETLLELNVYPNPNNGQFTIDLPREAQIVIMDAVGKELLNHKFSAGKQMLELNNIDNGIYFINAIIGEQKITHKIIINK